MIATTLVRPVLAAGVLLASIAAGAQAQGTVTVTSLLAEGYTVVSTFMSRIGPGIFLQNGAKLFVCFVEEKRDTTDLKTVYCKPVV